MTLLLYFRKIKLWQWCDVITPWQQSTWSCSPLNLGLVNSYHSCYSIRLDQDLLPWWILKSLNSGATQVFGYCKTGSPIACWYQSPILSTWWEIFRKTRYLEVSISGKRCLLSSLFQKNKTVTVMWFHPGSSPFARRSCPPLKPDLVNLYQDLLRGWILLNCESCSYTHYLENAVENWLG